MLGQVMLCKVNVAYVARIIYGWSRFFNFDFSVTIITLR
jgi:uncharacterized membrane protein